MADPVPRGKAREHALEIGAELGAEIAALLHDDRRQAEPGDLARDRPKPPVVTASPPNGSPSKASRPSASTRASVPNASMRSSAVPRAARNASSPLPRGSGRLRLAPRPAPSPRSAAWPQKNG
jgi:hypothetical protein